MLSFTGGLRVFPAVEPADMRKGFEGLHALVGRRLGEEVKSGALFVFTNKRRTRLKVLYFDGTGTWLMSKRLEEGTFCWPKADDVNAAKPALRPEAFAMLTDGIDLRGAKLRRVVSARGVSGWVNSCLQTIANYTKDS